MQNIILTADCHLDHIPEQQGLREIGEYKTRVTVRESVVSMIRAGHYIQILFLYAVQMRETVSLAYRAGTAEVGILTTIGMDHDVGETAPFTFLRIASDAPQHNGRIYNYLKKR
jgi:hypothetical protein